VIGISTIVTAISFLHSLDEVIANQVLTPTVYLKIFGYIQAGLICKCSKFVSVLLARRGSEYPKERFSRNRHYIGLEREWIS
jgi:hypothetical protein